MTKIKRSRQQPGADLHPCSNFSSKTRQNNTWDLIMRHLYIYIIYVLYVVLPAHSRVNLVHVNFPREWERG